MFWVDCGSEASAQSDFEKIGVQCGWSLAGAQALDGVMYQLARSTRPSLLILDNCDDVRTDYNRYIPNGSKVSVILTTRLSDAEKYASVDPRDAKSRLFVQLKGLDEESAVHLVLGASKIEECGQQITNQARKIAASLDYHPLAITVASSLIRGDVYSLEEYVVALQQRLVKKELLDEVSEQARYQKVSTTFEVSADALEKLASTDPSAKAALALLDILGFMHHQDVSEEMFVRAWKYEETVLSKFGDADGDEDGDITHLSAWHVTRCQSVFSSSPPDERTRLFRRARNHLKRLSLVSVDGLEKITSLHLMVHAWARERVSRPCETWTAVASILALSTKGCTDWQPFTSQLASHHEVNFTIWNDMGKPNNDQLEICRIWYAYAWQLYRAQSSVTLKVCFQLLEQTRELCHGQLEMPAFTGVQYLLGIAYRANGQISEAVETLEHVVKVREKLAEDHPDRLASQHALAVAYRANGQIQKAVEILEHVVKVLEHVVKVREKLAEDHPDRLASQHALAFAYSANGQISEAVELLKPVVLIKQRKLHVNHRSRTVSEDLLASLVSKLAKTQWQHARIPIEKESGHETNRTKRRKLEDRIEETTT